MFFLGAFNLLVVNLQVPLLQQGNGQPEPARCYPCLPELQFKADSKVCSKKSWNPDPFHVNMFFFQKKNGCTGDMSDCFPSASPHCNQQLLAKAAAHRLYLERSNPPTILPLVMEVAILRQPATSWGTTRPKPPKTRTRNPPTHQHSYNHSSPGIPTFPMTRALPVWQAAARAVSWELLRWWRSAWKKTPQPSWGINLPPTFMKFRWRFEMKNDSWKWISHEFWSNPQILQNKKHSIKKDALRSRSAAATSQCPYPELKAPDIFRGKEKNWCWIQISQSSWF